MVKKINHEQFAKLIKLYYKQVSNGKKIPLLAYGTFGVGKSAVTKQTAIEIAEKKGKKFVDWNTAQLEQKDEIAQNPQDYFILMDIRLSEYDSSDIKGLPDFKGDGETIMWKTPFWAKVVTHPNSDGLLFFDEPRIYKTIVKMYIKRIKRST